MDKRMAEEARLLMLPAEQKLSNDWGERDHEEVTQAGAAWVCFEHLPSKQTAWGSPDGPNGVMSPRTQARQLKSSARNYESNHPLRWLSCRRHCCWAVYYAGKIWIRKKWFTNMWPPDEGVSSKLNTCAFFMSPFYSPCKAIFRWVVFLKVWTRTQFLHSSKVPSNFKQQMTRIGAESHFFRSRNNTCSKELKVKLLLRRQTSNKRFFVTQ